MKTLSPEQTPDASTLAKEVRRYRAVGVLDMRAARYADWRPWNANVDACAEIQEQAVRDERRRCAEICLLCGDMAAKFIEDGTPAVVAQMLMGVER